jgi:hypothetical protein
VFIELKNFERRGREGFAEGAEEKEKIKTVKRIHAKANTVESHFQFWYSFLRPLRILRVLCVQIIFS